MPGRVHLLLLVVVAVGMPSAASAALWSPTTGVPVCGDSCRSNAHAVREDGAGGFYVTWWEDRNPTTRPDAYLQRITGAGQVAPGWPAGGLALASLPRAEGPLAITRDGEGGVFVAWQDDRAVGQTFGSGWDAYVQRVRGDGTLAPGWPVNGAPACTALSGQYPEALVPDGTGGVYVVMLDQRDFPTLGYDLYAQRFTATGAVAPGWPAEGRPVSTASYHQVAPRAVSDGAGGVVIVWEDCRAGKCEAVPRTADSYGLRLLADGTVAPGWTEGGTLLATGKTIPQVVADDAGGFYLATSTPHPEFNYAEVWVDRFSFSGERAAGWPEGGIRVCGAPGERHPLRAAAPDGSGGLLLAWTDFRGPGPPAIYATRVLAGGTVAPGWGADGVPVGPLSGGQSFHPELVGDGSGGVYVAWDWEDYATGRTHSRVQRITALGIVAPGWPMDGAFASTSLSQHFPHVVSDAAGGAIVVWEERGARPRGGLFAQRFAAAGPTPVVMALVSAEATSERVGLRWNGRGAGVLAASVERRTATDPWERLGVALRDGEDGLAYEDRQILPGARYAYRLTYLEAGEVRVTGESWIEVPLATRFALRGVTPNPSAGDPVVAFSLAGHEPARLEVYDLHGRLVASREWAAIGPGDHRVQIPGPEPLRAGVYGLRLRQGSQVATARAVVIR